MKATLFEDMIVSFGGDTEIGALPKGVGLDRLRWDGKTLVDLDKLSAIWVRCRSGVFELHAVPVSGAQLVAMRYQDRKRLFIDGDTIRIWTEQELEVLKSAEALYRQDLLRLKADTVAFIGGLTYDQIDAHIDTVFGALNAAQKTSLKRLYRVVLFLCKREIG